MINSFKENFKSLLLPLILNIALILFVYQSVFLLEIQGDTWHYAWGHQIYYGSNVFGDLSLQGMRSSLGGASLTYGLIQNNLGISGSIHYPISIAFKFLTVIVFYILVRKLTKSNFASLIASLILSVTFAGVEATHWVFNMYAYIGLTFIMLSIIIGLDQAEDYKFKKWLISFVFACLGIWYATMRTNGIIPLILVWSLYKLITLRSDSSKKNLISWIVGFVVFILIDKFLLGQMETDYSQHHIIGAGLRAFQSQISSGKYDFFLSPVSNLGAIILPDITWFSLNFPKTFSLLGSSPFRSVILPSFLIFSLIAWVLSSLFPKKKETSSWFLSNFILIFFLGLLWTIIVFFVSRLGPLNFSSWVNLIIALFGGYFMMLSLFLVIVKGVPANLKDLFFLSFFWSFLFLLLPLFMNGGPLNLGTYQRYMVSTAPVVPLFMAGLITLVLKYKNEFSRILVFLIAFLMIFSHATQTKVFFDRKAVVHNKQLNAKIWKQFTEIVPNKPEYAKENPPTIWFEGADNPLDQETLFETLYFGFLFQASIKYGWNPQYGANLYNLNYKDLLEFIKKNPEKTKDLYGVRMENQSLIDVTDELRKKLHEDIEQGS